MKYMETTGRTIQESFEKYHDSNPIVYQVFKKYVQQAISHGYKKYSAKQILGRVRWHLNFETKVEEEYKINDAFTSRYARLYVEEHPEHKDFFNYRRIRSL